MTKVYNDYQTLPFYIDLAKKTINKFGRKMHIGLSSEMLKNEDAVADVAHAIMMADWNYDDSRVGKKTGKKKTRYSYRNQCALWAIQTYATKSKKKKNFFLSIDALIDKSGSENTFESILADKKQTDPADNVIYNEASDLTTELINEIFASNMLTDKQAKQIKMYYIDGMTLQQIGDTFSVSREAVRQSIKIGIEKIRHVLT